jgi:pyruvate kinase
MDYAITATLGPGSAGRAAWEGMLAAGATGLRLNTSHLSLAQLQDWLERLDPFLASFDTRPHLVLDLQGSKWRLGEFTPCTLAAGQLIELVYAPSTERAGVLPLPHEDFFKAAQVSSGEVVLNDAKLRLQVEAIQPERVTARVVLGGSIAPHKGITFTASEYRQEHLSAKDQAIVDQTRTIPAIQYAISYLRDAAETLKYRELLGAPAYLIAKLERRPAIEDALQMAGIANELWLCRGDLGAELGIRAMAETVYQFSERVRDLRVPVFLAGQVLEHMTAQPSPTRSEVCAIYDALARGYQGLVLSDETAIGRFPVESCQAAALFKG